MEYGAHGPMTAGAEASVTGGAEARLALLMRSQYCQGHLILHCLYLDSTEHRPPPPEHTKVSDTAFFTSRQMRATGSYALTMEYLVKQRLLVFQLVGCEPLNSCQEG